MRGQKSHAPKIQLITAINLPPFMGARSHITQWCPCSCFINVNKSPHFLHKDVDFHSPALLRERENSSSEADPTSPVKNQRDVTGGRSTCRTTLSAVQRASLLFLSQEEKLGILLPTSVLTTRVPPSPVPAFRPTTGLWCSKRTHCPCEASLWNLPSARPQAPCAGNYTTAVALAPTSVLHTSVITLHL